MIMKTTSSMSPNSSTLERILVLRSQWEQMVSEYKLRDYNGTLDNLRWFIKYGVRSNRFRPHFDKAVAIANEIVNEASKYETSNLSSIHRQTK